MGKGGAKSNYGAFAKDDIEDAKRGEPAGTLDAYAAARGLTAMGQVQFTAFRGVLPSYPEYIFNVVRGELPGGGVGVLEHELQEVETDTSRGILWGGEFYGTHYTAKGPKGFWNKVLPFEITDSTPPDEPFAASALWVPVTAAVVRVPQAALLPRVLVRHKDRLPFGNPTLDEFGVAGFRTEGPEIPPELRAAMFGGKVGETLRTFPHPYVEVRLSHGAVALRRNGYVMDDDRLDDVARAAGAIAAGLAEAAAPLHRPQAFADELPAPGDGPPADVPWYEWPSSEWREAFTRLTRELGLTQEDPVALHRAFPTLAVPGIAQGVLRGALPGWDGVEGRLVYTAHGRGTSGQMRGAVVFAAPPSLPSPPAFVPGGTLVTETDMYVEVVDGLAAVWNRVRGERRLDAVSTIERALATARQVGLLPGPNS